MLDMLPKSEMSSPLPSRAVSPARASALLLCASILLFLIPCVIPCASTAQTADGEMLPDEIEYSEPEVVEGNGEDLETEDLETDVKVADDWTEFEAQGSEAGESESEDLEAEAEVAGDWTEYVETEELEGEDAEEAFEESLRDFELARYEIETFEPEGAAVETEPLELAPCRLADASGLVRISAQCATLEVPEDRNAEETTTVELFIAVLPAKSKHPNPDALTVITGGPGQASTQFFVTFADAFQRIRRERDIVLVDQRGTGRSNPLTCDAIDELDPWNAGSTEALSESVRACLKQLPGDPRHYTTSVAVRDLEAVRVALGYESLNLYGISYGTRVALHYLRRYPESTRTVILDGVVPGDWSIGATVSPDAQRTLDRIFAACIDDVECNRVFPELPAAFLALRERLREAPAKVKLDDPLDGTPQEIEFGERELALAVRMLSYSPEASSLLPLLIFDASETGDLRRLAAQAISVGRSLSKEINFGMHSSVVCTEDVPFFVLADPTLGAGSAYLGTLVTDQLATICAEWPQGEMDPDLKRPVSSDRPVLLLSGELDPITPPSNAERAAASLRQRLHLVGRGQGHGMATRGCTPHLMAEFVESGSLVDLDATCLEELDRAPFFVRLTGPEP
jgi:pimeloyl-ACP methyl ester carboxylesterase